MVQHFEFPTDRVRAWIKVKADLEALMMKYEVAPGVQRVVMERLEGFFAEFHQNLVDLTTHAAVHGMADPELVGRLYGHVMTERVLAEISLQEALADLDRPPEGA